MARVSITEAARLAGIGRSSFYQTYINKGAISVSKDSSGKKFIETSELIRVFGELPEHPSDNTTNIQPLDQKQADNTELLVALGEYKAEKRQLETQLSESREREVFYQSQIKELTNTLKLLEAPKHPQHPRLWYQFWK